MSQGSGDYFMSQRASTGKSSASNASSSKSSSGFSRRLTGLISRKSTQGPAKEKAKNEFGLNTVFDPDETTPVIADFVFVHGLGGGSSTTWCLKQNPEYFWPKEWLPKDPDFEGVRVHSFGYNATWATWLKSPLDVHAFGQSLVEELLSDPKVKGQDTPIVLIGHSMGGLVIKKTCILLKTNPEFAHLAKRLHSFYFLGTPHRGSNLAGVLNNLLRVSGSGHRAYVSGLETKSEMIRGLSDGFRVNYAGINLHTFYESQPTPPVGMIVDMESATLGYAEERVQLLNANHRDLAKFESVNDSNYRSLRNRLASTVQQIRDELQRLQELKEHQPLLLDLKEHQPLPLRPLDPETDLGEVPSLSRFQSSNENEQMEMIGAYLSIDQSPDDNLSSLDDTRLKGSCSWLPAKDSFQEWRSSSTPRYFWLKGAPASGKSTIASYVIEYLKGSPICYYFFKTGEKMVPNLSSFLRSMAYQMARVNPVVRDALFQLSQQGPPIDIRNQRSIWHNVFTGCVFHEKFQRPHFWVIDALDEAADRGPLDEYFLLLSKIDDNIPLKVFITSRPLSVLDNLFTRLPTITELITPDDSMDDIRLYVDTWSANLPVAGVQERKELVESIVQMSGGSFLWTVLVMQQLQDVDLVEEVHEVLDEVPQQMSELYRHNIKRMESSRSKGLAKHIITWAICSVHPLTVDQMKDAIKLSLDMALARNLRTSLQYICGQFLDVDKQSRVQVVHSTARAFLTDPGLDSEFRVDVKVGHGMIATACLKYLLSDELKYSKWRRSSSATSGASKTSIADYACLRFSEHVFRASSSSDELFEMLVKFFETNVLSWIERVAQLKDLDCLNRTSRHLSSFLGRRAKYVPMLTRDLIAWAVDLPRIVTQFGVNLLNDPAAIHTLIPPFCPRESAIYQHFGYAEDGIKLVGAWSSGWDDRICSISYHETYTTVVAARDQLFAVGLTDGEAKIYRTSTCEELLTLAHEESFSVLEFGPTSKFLASAGLRHMRLWDATTGKQLFHVGTDSQTLALGFNEDETWLMIASRDKHISAYQIPDGSQLYTLPWTDTFIEPRESSFPPSPSATKISIEQQVMAVVYRSKPVQLWSLENKRPIGACIRPSTNKHGHAGHIVYSVAFNPNPANTSLLVSYWDEVLTTFDIRTCKPLATTSAGLDKIAIAPNGKTFAGGDEAGAIKIFDFETLQLLHRIQVQGDPVTSLVFTSDNLRIIDVRGTQANVWEPLVLVSQDNDSQSSEPSESVHQITDDIGVSVVDQSAAITSLYCCEETGIAFCGRNDGRVDTCNLDDPEKTMRNLYKHRGSFTSVTCIDWAHKPRIAASADSSGKFRIMQITTGTRREWSAEILVESQLEQGYTISQVLVHPDGTFLLVSSSESDSVWSISTKKRAAVIPGRKRTAWKWFIRPSTPSQLLLFEDKVLKLFNWADLAELAASEAPILPVQIERRESESRADTDAISISSEGDDLVFVQRLYPSQQALQVMPSHTATTTKIHVFDLSSLGPYPIPSGAPSPSLSSSPFSQPSSFLQPISPPHLTNPFSTTPVSSSSHLSQPSPFSQPSPPSYLTNPFSTTPMTSPPVRTFSSSSNMSMSTRRRSSVRNVADIPDVESIIGTVKKFNSWFLIFISRKGWVCSVELGGGGGKVLDTFQKHFFVPSVWRTGNSPLITKVRRSQDIIFVHQDGVIVVKNGLDNGEHVLFF